MLKHGQSGSDAESREDAPAVYQNFNGAQVELHRLYEPCLY